MVSTIVILGVAATAFALAWSVLRTRGREIRGVEDWEVNKHAIDLDVLRALLGSGEEQWLRSSLPRAQFRIFERRRAALALRMLCLVESNAAMLMRLGELAKGEGDPALAESAEELLASALQLRLNLIPVKLSLYVKWVFPSWTVSAGILAVRYQNLLECLDRIEACGRPALA